MTKPMDSEIYDFATLHEWEEWLADHFDQSDGAWLRIAKKGSGRDSISIQNALDGALCYGWIDSIRRSYDETSYLQKYSPRRAKSPWSKINVKKVEVLITADRMRAPGYAEIHSAQTDGRWEVAYESQRTSITPPDLAAALARNIQALQAYERLDKTAQYVTYLPLLKATSPENRAVQLQKIMTKLSA